MSQKIRRALFNTLVSPTQIEFLRPGIRFPLDGHVSFILIGRNEKGFAIFISYIQLVTRANPYGTLSIKIIYILRAEGVPLPRDLALVTVLALQFQTILPILPIKPENQTSFVT